MMALRARVARAAIVAMLALTSVGLLGPTCDSSSRSSAQRQPANSADTTSPAIPSPAPAIPEPAGFVVFALGAGVVGLSLRRRSRRS